MVKVKVEVEVSVVTGGAGNGGGKGIVDCSTPPLNGPRPTVVLAATLMLYITPGSRLVKVN